MIENMCRDLSVGGEFVENGAGNLHLYSYRLGSKDELLHFDARVFIYLLWKFDADIFILCQSLNGLVGWPLYPKGSCNARDTRVYDWANFLCLRSKSLHLFGSHISDTKVRVGCSRVVQVSHEVIMLS